MLSTFAFTQGTHRIVPPEQTLRRITPHLAGMGITRCHEVTGLDTLGVPTFSAIRPRAYTLQTSSGKGQSRIAAQVSALMECIELHHAENPTGIVHADAAGLEADGWRVIAPDRLDSYQGGYYAADFRTDWVEAESLRGGERAMIPASAVYFMEPATCSTSTNGLASGNSLEEATLHALYELIERDAISGVSEGGTLQIKKHCRIVNLDTVTDPVLREMISRIEAARTKVVLMWVASCVPIHTFWAALLNRAPLRSVSTLNVGYGAHAAIEVAASRAITEAAQSRGVFIHGSREDLCWKPVHDVEDVTRSAAYEYFDSLLQNAPWTQLGEGPCALATTSVEGTLEKLLELLATAGHHDIYRHDLTRQELGIPVVKVLVPTMRFNTNVM